ncbi:hypothetical protein N1031_20110 [Herbiconiux moechotypicola]|uniref:Uncharacterized protein n=1 Tax=Herbiconiux moechotypicola TaxID=637393 RepID=A0ABN3E7M6_9MICO|nr:hypothetical protein [Herbiconiux moechotypicola]MCS5732066.1 hypothetical protein [Herbiconiux moechotypicola]
MTVSTPARRPALVTVAVVLVYITGIADVLLGILAVFARYLPEAELDGLAFPVTVLGAAMIIIGLGIVALASGLARGSRFARGLLTALLLIGLALDLTGFVLAPEGGPSTVIAQAVVAAVVLLPLWFGPGARWLRASRPNV